MEYYEKIKQYNIIEFELIKFGKALNNGNSGCFHHRVESLIQDLILIEKRKIIYTKLLSFIQESNFKKDIKEYLIHFISKSLGINYYLNYQIPNSLKATIKKNKVFDYAMVEGFENYKKAPNVGSELRQSANIENYNIPFDFHKPNSLRPSLKKQFKPLKKELQLDLKELDHFQKNLLSYCDKAYFKRLKNKGELTNPTASIIHNLNSDIEFYRNVKIIVDENLKEKYFKYLRNWFELQLDNRKKIGIDILKPEYQIIFKKLFPNFSSESDLAQNKTLPPQPINESPFSVLEWATIFYYADETNLLPENRTINARIEQFINKYKIDTTIKYFRTQYYEAKKRINKKNDYPINKLELIIPFLKENYKQTVTKVENDIIFLEENKPEY